MRYGKPLIKATFVRRYKRFLVDCQLENGEEITAHLANTGRMTACLSRNCDLRLSLSDNPKRKLAYSVEQSIVDGRRIMVNTGRANAVIAASLSSKEGFTNVEELVGEVPWPSTGRADFRGVEVMEGGVVRPVWVEVKSVTLRQDDWGLFPDAPSARAHRHLEALEECVAMGHRAVLILLGASEGVERIAPAWEVDRSYGHALRRAHGLGVEIWGFSCTLCDEGVTLGERVEVDLSVPPMPVDEA